MTDDDKPFPLITHPKKRAWLTAYAITGRTDLACKAAGMTKPTLYRPFWKDDNEFQEAREEARGMAADLLVDTATQRAVEGTRSYKFNKDGIPLKHPEECECGHHLRAHVKRAGGGDSLTPRCIESLCACSQFIGAPYFEHSYSDTLLIFLTKGALPERYREIREVRGILANLDLNMLPNDMIQRIAQGEPIEAVLAAGASEHGLTPGQLIRGALAPGEPERSAPDAEE